MHCRTIRRVSDWQVDERELETSSNCWCFTPHEPLPFSERRENRTVVDGNQEDACVVITWHARAKGDNYNRITLFVISYDKCGTFGAVY